MTLDFNSRPREGGDLTPSSSAICLYISIRAPARGATSRVVCHIHVLTISIRAPARGATGALGHTNSHPKFQFAPPRGGRLSKSAPCWRKSNFNSRPREGGDPCFPCSRVAPFPFQFAPPRGGRPPGAGYRRHGIHFNSRPREGGDVVSHDGSRVLLISIRAPARGATGLTIGMMAMMKFQFAPPRGGRPPGKPVQLIHQISIRAPARGATRIDPLPRGYRIFQFAPPRGGRLPRVLT